MFIAFVCIGEAKSKILHTELQKWTGQNDWHLFKTFRNEVFKERNAAPTVKHGGASLMFWGYFEASGLTLWNHYHRLLGGNVGPSVRKLGLHQRSWALQQDNIRYIRSRAVSKRRVQNSSMEVWVLCKISLCVFSMQTKKTPKTWE